MAKGYHVKIEYEVHERMTIDKVKGFWTLVKDMPQIDDVIDARELVHHLTERNAKKEIEAEYRVCKITRELITI